MFEKVLAVVAVLVFVGVAVLGILAVLSDGDDDAVPEGCDGSRVDTDLAGESSPSDALRLFVQDRSDEFPVDDNWVLESDEDGRYLFVNDQGGHYEVEVEDGLVRRYLSCPDA